jgi:hypothetical protein
MASISPGVFLKDLNLAVASGIEWILEVFVLGSQVSEERARRSIGHL